MEDKNNKNNLKIIYGYVENLWMKISYKNFYYINTTSDIEKKFRFKNIFHWTNYKITINKTTIDKYFYNSKIKMKIKENNERYLPFNYYANWPHSDVN